MNKPDKIVPEAKLPPRISVEELDRRFDAGEDVSAYFDFASATRPNLVPQRVSLDLPTWMVRRLDSQAEKQGVSREALIAMWLTDRLEAAG